MSNRIDSRDSTEGIYPEVDYALMDETQYFQALSAKRDEMSKYE